jgi:hypothetical protein
MNFSEFQNQARLYVIGALESEELEEFEKAREKFGKKAKTSSRNLTRYAKRLLGLRRRSIFRHQGVVGDG